MNLSEEEFQTLVQLAKKVLWTDRGTRKRLEQQKLHITPANFYASIPSIEDYEKSFEFREPEQTQGSYNSPTAASDAAILDKIGFCLSRMGCWILNSNSAVGLVSCLHVCENILTHVYSLFQVSASIYFYALRVVY